MSDKIPSFVVVNSALLKMQPDGFTVAFIREAVREHQLRDPMRQLQRVVDQVSLGCFPFPVRLSVQVLATVSVFTPVLRVEMDVLERTTGLPTTVFSDCVYDAQARAIVQGAHPGDRMTSRHAENLPSDEQCLAFVCACAERAVLHELHENLTFARRRVLDPHHTQDEVPGLREATDRILRQALPREE